jgi:hypothetical protein
VPSGGEGSEAAAEEGSGSADEGSGIPPGMPEEGTDAYDLLIERLCAKLTTGNQTCFGLSGGTNGAPRNFMVWSPGGTGAPSLTTIWTEQADGSWQEGEPVSDEEWGGDKRNPDFMTLLPEVKGAVRRPSEAENAAARAELEKQGVCTHSTEAEQFFDLNNDGQTECVEWQWVECYRTYLPAVYFRGADGQWAENSAAAETYFTQPE